MSNWNTGDPDAEIKPAPQTFSWSDYRKVEAVIKDRAYYELGLFAEPFSMEELIDLFVPRELISPLRIVYNIEEDTQARGTVYIDCANFLNEQIFEEEGDPYCNCTRAILRIQWNRAHNPGGFITPTPLFGTMVSPINGFNGALNFAYNDFIAEVQQLIKIMGRWAITNWVFAQLQNSVRTPPQMRYVWPAIYTLATEAKLSMAPSLATTSARAGMNANPSAQVRDYLKPTYEVVSHSVLAERDEKMNKRWTQGQIQLVSCSFQIMTAREGNPTVVQGL